MSNLRRMLMIGPAVLLLGIGTSWAHEEVSVHTSPSELWVEPHVVGAGVKLTRIIGQPALSDLDPFLLLDEFRSDEASDYIAGFPEHPHRGFAPR